MGDILLVVWVFLIDLYAVDEFIKTIKEEQNNTFTWRYLLILCLRQLNPLIFFRENPKRKNELNYIYIPNWVWIILVIVFFPFTILILILTILGTIFSALFTAVYFYSGCNKTKKKM